MSALDNFPAQEQSAHYQHGESKPKRTLFFSGNGKTDKQNQEE